jgi:hypothetical protein
MSNSKILLVDKIHLAKALEVLKVSMNNSEELADNKVEAASAIFLNSLSRCSEETRNKEVANQCSKKALIFQLISNLISWMLSKECLKLFSLIEQILVVLVKAQSLSQAPQLQLVVDVVVKVSRLLDKDHL